MIVNELFVAGKAMGINMKKLFLPLLVASVCLSMLTACSQIISDTATDSTNENEVTVSVTEQNSNPDLSTTSSNVSVGQDETTAKTNTSKADKADNDVVFSNNETTTSAKKAETTSSAVAPSQNLNETTVVNNTKTDKNKITTDKDGWVDKWY
ncbi:hypothetical protein [Eubacterium coprostanoligenes]|uniref:Lipoprotein n=1 Tax=Eubacterium coprostanoligenes TaxID=290054 RepID=A0A1T4NB06_9FIRM|nr:hypothetical protein [Eubacterium coprostanoligenes]SJZ76263.1 hypothetical protein SAMN02745114_01537 [Eubacterium coprostanoligenes]